MYIATIINHGQVHVQWGFRNVKILQRCDDLGNGTDAGSVWWIEGVLCADAMLGEEYDTRLYLLKSLLQ